MDCHTSNESSISDLRD